MRFAPSGYRPAMWYVAQPGLLLLLCLPYGCDDSRRVAPKSASDEIERQVIARDGPRPEYSIPIEVRDAAPGAAAFVDHFLSICLTGDYSGYRRLVSRTRKPESKERFRAIYQGIKSVHVTHIDKIEPGKRSRLPGETYQVVAELEVRPASQLEVRGVRRRIALLVFREQKEWRMIPAPPRWQPIEEETQSTDKLSQAEPDDRDFPWDEDVDH